MGQKKRLKLCQYCDGQVDWDAFVCPYCGNDVSEKKKEEEKPFQPKAFSSKETSASLYPPPYQPKGFVQESEEEEISPMVAPKEMAAEPTESKSSFWPMLMISFGMNLALIGFFILFFSKNGQLLLKWDAHFWFVYVLLAVPLLFFGYKGLSKT